jgi:hypothetical protein
VDEVSLYYGKYWLRLRWPGPRGGVAGYIVIGDSKCIPPDAMKEWKGKLKGAIGGIQMIDNSRNEDASGHTRSSQNSEGGQSDGNHQGKFIGVFTNTS